MSNWKWTAAVNNGLNVGFSNPCVGNYGWRWWSLPCKEENRNHGHIVLSCEDGFGWIPFPCKSQAGVKAILVFDKSMTDEEKMAIQNLPEVQQLPIDMTPEEQHILEDPDLMWHFALANGCVSGWFS